ncbi:hypothetical protein COP1_007461 [Malus domestica]
MTQRSLKESVPYHVPATNLRKGQQVLEKHEDTEDLEMFRQTHLGSQYGKSREKSHALDQTFILPRGDGDLRNKALMVHDSTQDPLVLQLLKEVNKLRPNDKLRYLIGINLGLAFLQGGSLTPPPSKDKAKAWLAILYWKGGPD